MPDWFFSQGKATAVSKLKFIRLGISVAALCAAAAFAPALAVAADPSCGDSITHNVTLHHDLDCTSATADGLTISKNGITVDLNGHTMTGPGGAGTYQAIEDSGYDKLTVKHGTLKNWETGVYLSGPVAKAIVDHVTVKLDSTQSYYGVYADYPTGGRFTNIKVDNANEGIYLYEGSSNTVDHAKVTNSDYGFYVENAVGDVVKNSKALNGGGTSDGFYDYESDTKYINDVANGNYNGFYVDYPYGASIKKSTANNNGYVGVYFLDNLISDGYHGSVSQSTANHNEYGFYANEAGITGSGNHAVDNTYPCFYISCSAKAAPR